MIILFTKFRFKPYIFLGSQIERADNGVAVLKNHKGYLRLKPSDEERRDRRFVSNEWTKPGTEFTGVTGLGIKRMREGVNTDPYSGRQALRFAVLNCHFL